MMKKSRIEIKQKIAELSSGILDTYSDAAVSIAKWIEEYASDQYDSGESEGYEQGRSDWEEYSNDE